MADGEERKKEEQIGYLWQDCSTEQMVRQTLWVASQYKSEAH